MLSPEKDGARAPLRDSNFTDFGRRRRRNDPFGFRGGVLPPEFFHIKQQEHAGHHQERTDPFQEPTGVAQNLNRALSEILRIPRRLRHLEGLAAPGSPPTARKTEGTIHPALAGGTIALGGRDAQRALESSRRIVAFIARGPIVAMVVEGGPDTWKVVRTMMGATNPRDAAPGTIRGDLALETGENLVHGSDGPESAEREIALFFPDLV